MKKIGFIGIGIMGRGMAANLVKAGFELTVYTRRKEKIEDFLQQTGVQWAESPAKCAMGQEAVITMVGYPKDVEDVYFGENGILSGAEQGAFLIDMTTTDPRLSLRIAEAGREKNLHVLDAPVSGGDTGAREGTLSIMVGGNEADFAASLPLFCAMGKTIVYEGGHGAGQHTKMANQIAIAGALAGVCEAVAYGERVGLDTAKMLESIENGAAGSFQMRANGPKMINGDDAPGFFLKHFVKDMRIALEQSADPLPILEQVLKMNEALEKEGFGDCGTQAMIHSYRKS